MDPSSWTELWWLIDVAKQLKSWSDARRNIQMPFLSTLPGHLVKSDSARIVFVSIVM